MSESESEVPGGKRFVDEYIYKRIPDDSTYSWIHFLMVFIGMWTSVVALGAGIDMGQSLTPWVASAGIFAGYMIAMVIGLLTGWIGLKERLPIASLLERPFGLRGSLIPIFVVFLMGGVFIGVQADAVVRIILTVVGVEEVAVVGPVTNRAIVAVVLTTLMMLTAYKGFEHIRIVSWISMPLYLLALLLATVFAVRTFDGGVVDVLTIQHSGASFEAAVFLGLSLYAGFSALLPDVSRFVRNERNLYTALLLGYPIASLIPISGVLMGGALEMPYWEIFSLYGILFGVFASVSIFMAQWTTNDNNAFTAGLALAGFSGVLNRVTDRFPYITRSQATLIPITLGIILAGLGTGAVAPLLAAVGALGSWLPPMAGVLVGHYLVVERMLAGTTYTRGVSALVSFLGVSITVHMGLIPWAAILGFVGALVLYPVLYLGVERRLVGDKTMDEEPIIEATDGDLGVDLMG